MERAFVLLSGGMDSTTCLYIAKERYREVEAVSVDYGQKHKKEMVFAREHCHSLGIKHSILSIGGILSGIGVMLTDSDTAIPNVSYDEIHGVSPTYVPFRNGTLLSVITAIAQKWVMHRIDGMVIPNLVPNQPEKVAFAREQALRADALDVMKDSVGVFFGAHAEDAHNWAYPDCTPEFIGAMANAIYTGTYYTVRLNAPLMSLDKTQVVEWGTKLGVPWEKTWSCYKGEDRHCGQCPTCQSRRKAFIQAGVEDPTEYAV